MKNKRSSRFSSSRIENKACIQSINAFIKRQRGYVLQLPKPATPVILLISGGIDSTVTWAQLLSTYQLQVFPVHIMTGQPRNTYEQRAIRFYARELKYRYPQNFHEPLFVSQHTTPPEIRHYYRSDLASWVHTSLLKQRANSKSNTIWLKREFTFPAFLPYQGLVAAQFLYFKTGEKIRTIISSTLPTDAEYNASQSLTANRVTMQAMCAYTNDYSWQFFSFADEPELGRHLEKKDLIDWAAKHQLDLGKTYSCFRGTSQNCGYCLACEVRKDYFNRAKVVDTTMYQGKTWVSNLFDGYQNFKISTKSFFSSKTRSTRIIKFQDYY